MHDRDLATHPDIAAEFIVRHLLLLLMDGFNNQLGVRVFTSELPESSLSSDSM